MINEGSDYDWIIDDIIYILIALTWGSGELSLQANANKTQLLTRDTVQTGLEFKQQSGIEFPWSEEEAGGEQRVCD